MKILFISAFNLTTNPRISKELKYAINLNYTCDFIGIDLGGWSAKIDKKIIPSLNARKLTFLPITRKNFFNWLVWAFLEKLACSLSIIFKNSLWLNALAHSRRSIILWNFIRKQKQHYDLIIAHTLPSLYPAYKLSKIKKIPFIFDVEDYHPGEKCSRQEQQRRKFLMSKLLPYANFITCASEMICEYTLKLIPNFNKNKTQTVYNSFAQEEFTLYISQKTNIQFVWFSQNIASNRGLELILPALYKYKHIVNLTLIGNLYQDFYNNFLAKYSEILTIKQPMPQTELNKEICKYDIGLALELNQSDFNRSICLTNKIFAYAQAGLYILATNTPAQERFISQHPILGITTKQNSIEIEKIIKLIINNKDNIIKQKPKRFRYAKKLSWDKEKQKISQIWKSFDS